MNKITELPLELLGHILSFLAPVTLKKLHTENRYGRLFNDIVESLLFRRISYGGQLDAKILGINAKELERLALGEYRCPVEYLEIRTALPRVLDEQVLKQYREFFLSIPKVVYYGDPESLLKFVSADSTNIVLVHFSDMNEPSKLQFVPPSTENLEVVQLMEVVKAHQWPENLKNLELVGHASTDIEYPETLQSLCVTNSFHYWTALPRNLRSLTLLAREPLFIQDHHELFLPPNLTELTLRNGRLVELNFLHKVPHLKKLDLKNNLVSSLKWRELPPKLEILNLSDNKLHSLKKVRFPLTLKELYVANNRLRTMRHVSVPKLTVLDISVDGGVDLIKHSDKMFLPPTLHTLNARGQYKIDWRKTKFPESLRNLSLEFEKACNIDFSNLEVLHIGTSFPTCQLNALKFPDTLVDLTIRGGKPSRPILDLPNLRRLAIEPDNVPRVFPPHLDHLALCSPCLYDLREVFPARYFEEEFD